MAANAARPDDPKAIRETIARYLDERLLPAETITPETDLIEASLLDSLLIMDLIAHIDTTFGVKLDGADVAPRHFRTPASLANLIVSRQA